MAPARKTTTASGGPDVRARLVTITRSLVWEPEDVARLLAGDPTIVFRTDPPRQPRRSADVPVELSVSAGAVSLHAAGRLFLGAPARRGPDLTRPASVLPERRHLLAPRFDGTITSHPSGTGLAEVRLAGLVTPPLGLAGRAFHRLAGHRLAERSLARLMDDIVHRLNLILGAAPPPREEPRPWSPERLDEARRSLHGWG